MKGVKISLAVLVAALMAMGVATQAQAFHSGGVAECEGCHSMHNSFEGSANVTGKAQYTGGPYLLKASDQSGACLNCHEGSPGSYHISTPNINLSDSTTPAQKTAGGDFAWLKKSMVGLIRNTPTTWEGDRHGHNIVAVDYGYDKDGHFTTSPGGSYPADKLACSSCHDPHGKYRRLADGSQVTTGLPIFASGSYNNTAAPIPNVSALGVYRLLGGNGYYPQSVGSTSQFTKPAPDAVSPSSYNAANTTIAGVADRVAYGRGMSEWCSNCHASMHNSVAYVSGNEAGIVHPAGNLGKLTAPIATNYAAYVSSGITGTPPMGGYSALAPFETGMVTGDLADYTALKTFQTAPTAPDTTSNVLCLSCHRAHASAFESMARYSLGNEFMTVADASNAAIYDSSTTENKINFGYSQEQQQAAYNGRPATLFGPYARNYCNKCHAKD